MSCLPDAKPTNPISQLIMGALGENYFPPYDANFQPVDRTKLTEDRFLKLQTPGGGKIKPIGDPKHTHISEFLTPISGALGAIFAFFGPLYIILDVIRALIDIICSLFNPIPLILTVVDLFVNVLPPLIALFPPLSTILHAINVAKVVTAIVGSIAASLIPIIAEIVESSLSIATELANGNLNAVELIEIKICELLADFLNAIGAFGPIKFILELIETFMNLAAVFPCVPSLPGLPGSPCCSTENCPPVVINPPTGRMRVLHRIERFTLADLWEMMTGAIKPPLEKISEILNDVVKLALESIEDAMNSIPIGGVIEAVKLLLDTVNGLVLGALDDFIEDLELDEFQLGDLLPNFPELDLGSVLDTPDGWDEIFLIHPLMTLEYLSAVSAQNENGLVSIKGVGSEYSASELEDIQNFIIPPDTIPLPLPKIPSFFGASDSTSVEEDPATMKVEMTAGNNTKVAPALFQFPTINTISNRLNIPASSIRNILNTFGYGYIPTDALGIIQVYDDSFEVGTEVEYTIRPQQIELLKNNLIGLGCLNDIQSASLALFERMTADVQAARDVSGDSSVSTFDPVSKKINRPFPPPPEQDLQDLLQQMTEDPTTAVDPLPILNDYLDDLADFVDSLVCIGASSVESEFSSSKQYVLANGKDYSILSLNIRDQGGNNLLAGGLLPGSDFTAQFTTTFGKVSDVEFEPDSGTFFATISSDEIGVAEVTAEFVVRNKVCMRSATFDDLSVKPQIEIVNFVAERGAFQRVRKKPQYVQSRGGRVRR